MLHQALIFSVLLVSNPANPRPVCSASNRGMMWPAQANADSRLAIKLSRTGDLQICIKGPWKYHWHTPAIHWQDLRKDKTKHGE